MPDRPDDLTPFADALARLAPQPPTLSRDALLFAAGRAAAAPRLPGWTWPTAAAFFAGLSLVLTAFLASPGTGGGEVRVVTQYVPMPGPVRIVEEPRPPVPEVLPPAKSKPAESPPDDTVRMLRVRRDVYRWGLDMLPRSTAAGPAAPSGVTSRDLDRWLNLPPGTLAFPTVRKTGPTTEKDDDDQ